MQSRPVPSESNHGGSPVASCAVWVVLALLAAMFVLVFSTRVTLLTGAAVMIVVVLALTALRNRKR